MQTVGATLAVALKPNTIARNYGRPQG